DKMHAALIERSFRGRIVGVIARDATQIEAREKPTKKQPGDDPPPPSPPPPSPPPPSPPPPSPPPPAVGETLLAVDARPSKRGRPKKGTEPAKEQPKPEPKRIERQTDRSRCQPALPGSDLARRSKMTNSL